MKIFSKTKTKSNDNVRLTVPCIICGETVVLTKQETEYMCLPNATYLYKVCDNCKKAILKLREDDK